MIEKLVESVVNAEWQQFQHVRNEGGRASCQNDRVTFDIMRKSQYMTWPDELLLSYGNDIKEAFENNWNLITEKYARMMESTAYEKYKELEPQLPVRSSERRELVEKTAAIQVKWMEEFARKYPKLADNARSIHTYEDREYNTSYETYLRGELLTYSDKTMELYYKFVKELEKKGENLAQMIMENTVKLYGYESLEEAERDM